MWRPNHIRPRPYKPRRHSWQRVYRHRRSCSSPHRVENRRFQNDEAPSALDRIVCIAEDFLYASLRINLPEIRLLRRHKLARRRFGIVQRRTIRLRHNNGVLGQVAITIDSTTWSVRTNDRDARRPPFNQPLILAARSRPLSARPLPAGAAVSGRRARLIIAIFADVGLDQPQFPRQIARGACRRRSA